MPIFSRSYIARELDRARVLFGPTQAAIEHVAQHVHLPPADVARIAAEEVHGEALAEARARDAATGARALGHGTERVGCGQDCSRCACKTAGIEAEAVPY